MENSPFSIGDTSSNGGIFHCHLSFRGGQTVSEIFEKLPSEKTHILLKLFFIFCDELGCNFLIPRLAIFRIPNWTFP